MLWLLMLRFLLRLIFGITVALSVTSSRKVTSGFFRVHLWVLLGLNTFAGLIAASAPTRRSGRMLGLVIAGAVISYLGSVFWLYECRRSGKMALGLAALLALGANLMAAPWPESSGPATLLAVLLDVVSSGLLLGATISAMFLGHWYLNTPTMQLGPLRRLLWLIVVGIAARSVVCGMGLAVTVWAGGWPVGLFAATLALRWLAGLVGTLLLTIMVFKTLEIPNTQSATGILYVAVIFVFLGELSSQLLSASSSYLV